MAARVDEAQKVLDMFAAMGIEPPPELKGALEKRTCHVCNNAPGAFRFPTSSLDGLRNVEKLTVEDDGFSKTDGPPLTLEDVFNAVEDHFFCEKCLKVADPEQCYLMKDDDHWYPLFWGVAAKGTVKQAKELLETTGIQDYDPEQGKNYNIQKRVRFHWNPNGVEITKLWYDNGIKFQYVDNYLETGNYRGAEALLRHGVRVDICGVALKIRDGRIANTKTLTKEIPEFKHLYNSLYPDSDPVNTPFDYLVKHDPES